MGHNLRITRVRCATIYLSFTSIREEFVMEHLHSRLFTRIVALGFAAAGLAGCAAMTQEDAMMEEGAMMDAMTLRRWAASRMTGTANWPPRSTCHR